MKHSKMSIFGNKGKPNLLTSSSKTVSDILGVEHQARPLPIAPKKEKTWGVPKLVRSLLKKREEKTPIVVAPVMDGLKYTRQFKIPETIKTTKDIHSLKIENLILSPHHLERWSQLLNTASIGPNYETFQDIKDTLKYSSNHFQIEGDKNEITSSIYRLLELDSYKPMMEDDLKKLKENMYNTVVLSNLYLMIDEAAPGKYGPLLSTIMKFQNDKESKEDDKHILEIFYVLSQVTYPSTLPLFSQYVKSIERILVSDFTIVLCRMTDTFKSYTTYRFIHPQTILG